MAKGFLIDTNAAIYFLNNTLPESSNTFISNIITLNQSCLSFISEIELLAFPADSANHISACKTFISLMEAAFINQAIIKKTIEIRQATKIKLPDAIIAATALVNNFSLISSNFSDFAKVDGLELLDPYELG